MARFAASSIAGLLVAVALTACGRTPTTLPEIETAVKAQPEWLADTRTCPADAMDRDEVESVPESRFCDPVDHGACYADCVDGDGAACYWLANRLELGKRDAAAVDALYMRACREGVASGCTNRAVRGAGGDAASYDARCEMASFERTCGLDDPWGCTKFAFRLSQASDSEADRARALAALDKSCLNGEDDPACVAGRDLAEKLRP